VFSHLTLQQVFSNSIPHHMLSFSRQQNEVFLPRISHTFSPHFASYGGHEAKSQIVFLSAFTV
jgi:hypothetical protein